jgi:hypothetical protein
MKSVEAKVLIGLNIRDAPDIWYPTVYRTWHAGYPAGYLILKMAGYPANCFP